MPLDGTYRISLEIARYGPVFEGSLEYNWKVRSPFVQGVSSTRWEIEALPYQKARTCNLR